MPKQNRVSPFSQIFAVPTRGTLTGNRGCLHDDQGQIRRLFAGRRWIICLLEFRGRKRQIMRPGHYTELFFIDEATALAAGHRPCAECQRERFNLFRELWSKANLEVCGSERASAAQIDTALHSERLIGIRHPHLLPLVQNWAEVFALPDGTFVSNGENVAFLVWKDRLLRWSFEGYERFEIRSVAFPFTVLTPASVIRTLEAGFPVEVHPTAYR